VSRREFQDAVLAFLDQFIGRGAAQDIQELRTRLAVDENVRNLLDDQLPNDDPSNREAFDAMRSFLEIEHERHPLLGNAGNPDLAELLSWTKWASANEKGHFDDAGSLEITSDPAQWHDWVKSLEQARTAS
jgi:hypothetical protein